MLIAEIPLTPTSPDDFKEWLVVRKHDGYASIGVDYISRALGGERTSWQDQGIGIPFEHLDAVIDALVCIRDESRDRPAKATEKSE